VEVGVEVYVGVRLGVGVGLGMSVGLGVGDADACGVGVDVTVVGGVDVVSGVALEQPAMRRQIIRTITNMTNTFFIFLLFIF